ncbi:MAG: hypothetical protein CMC93_06805 [Flavobacteriaceae bacterium]|nr:hypothetical protein [Flavobacteriaceae bacterium]
MNVDRPVSILLALLGAAFAICIIYLVHHKAPWVDEMYTWYGIHHDAPGQLVESLGSGINYSPPLYFFLNWVCQLFLPLSLNALRIESLLWILGGTFMVYLMLRKQLGSVAAIIGVGGVLLQSNLLLEQSMEARAYGLFFFCGSAVLYAGQLISTKKCSRNMWAWAFLAHLALSLTHYLGIIFSGLAALSRYPTMGKRRIKKGMTSPEFASWIVSLPVYGYLLIRQSDHLAAWPRPNGLHDLLASYLDSINPLFFTVPIIFALLPSPSSRKQKGSIEHEGNKFILYCSILWICIPTLIWLLSHTTPLNLFKERYFIPKEAGWMVLVALLISRVPFFRSNSRKTLLPVGACMLLGLGVLIVSTKRQLFALNPSRNYYHWIIADESIRNSSLPKVYAGDHLYFPNQNPKAKENSFLWINDNALLKTYSLFSHKISTIKTEEVIDLQHFVLIHDYPKEDYAKRLNIGRADVKKKFSVNKHSKFFADEIRLQRNLLE